jgi:ABC-type phosphate transport system auxiliary subunit
MMAAIQQVVCLCNPHEIKPHQDPPTSPISRGPNKDNASGPRLEISKGAEQIVRSCMASLHLLVNEAKENATRDQMNKLHLELETLRDQAKALEVERTKTAKRTMDSKEELKKSVQKLREELDTLKQHNAEERDEMKQQNEDNASELKRNKDAVTDPADVLWTCDFRTIIYFISSRHSH